MGDVFEFYRDGDRDDFWHCGLNTLIHTAVDPDTVAGGPKMPHAFKPSNSLQARPEAADTGEHIKKSDCHTASDLFLMLFGHLTFP